VRGIRPRRGVLAGLSPVLAFLPTFAHMDHDGWWWGGWGIGMGLGMLLFWVIVIALGVWLFRWLADESRGRGVGERRDSALEILRERYARGEISREEFEGRKKDLT